MAAEVAEPANDGYETPGFMTKLSARLSLSLVWPILYAARFRDLTATEMNEMQVLCDAVRRGVPGCEEFNTAAELFCRRMHSDLAERPQRLKTDDLLDEIERLRDMLE